MLEEMYCGQCRTETLFEQPVCVDGHDADCPDRVCTVCGFAVVLAVVTVDAPMPAVSHRAAA